VEEGFESWDFSENADMLCHPNTFSVTENADKRFKDRLLSNAQKSNPNHL